jgi:hypothetical protein
MNRPSDARLLAIAAFVAPFLATPLGMSVYSLIHFGIGGTAQYPVAFAWGALGFALVALGLKQDEVRASVLGFLGGWLMWGGWFEFSFQLFAQVLRIPDLPIAPGIALPGSNGLQLASTPFLVVIVLLYGMLNRQTRCNFMRFLMRRTHLSPGMPVQGVARSISRTTAFETLCVIWALNSFWLSVFWATGMNTAFFVVLGLYAVWVLWLFTRLMRSTRPGPTLRYGVAVGILAWILVEMPAQLGLITEGWRRPFEHPWVAGAFLLLFATAIATVWRGRGRSNAAGALSAP